MMRVLQISDTHLSPTKTHFASNWPTLLAWAKEQRPDLIIHTGDVSVDGKTAAANAYVLTLNGTTLKPLRTEGDTAVLEGTKVFVSPVAADLLNDTFDTDAVAEDLLVGVATITVNTTSGD